MQTQSSIPAFAFMPTPAQRAQMFASEQAAKGRSEGIRAARFLIENGFRESAREALSKLRFVK
jgi:hypothetical protein